MRRLKQPGEARQPRRVVRPARANGELRLCLPAGADLLGELTRALAMRGVTDAAVQLVAGGFASLHYLTGQPDDSGERVATYGPPTALEGPIRLIAGNAILGHDLEGRPLLHCHAVVVDRAGGLHGGHLPADTCLVGAEGLVALATPLAGAGFRVAHDAETNYDIFQPTPVAVAGAPA